MSQITKSISSIGPAGPVTSIQGNTGPVVPPDGAGTIDVVGTGAISTSGAGNTLTIAYTDPSASVSFSAVKTSTSANETGDGTIVTVVFDSALYNIGAAYDNTTGIFTAPSDGLYNFFMALTLTNVNSLHSSGEMSFTGSAEDINVLTNNPGASFSPALSNSYSYSSSVVIQMSAGDTLSVQTAVSGDTKTVGIYGAALPGYLTWFRGYKIA